MTSEYKPPDDKSPATAGMPQPRCAPESTVAGLRDRLRAFKASLDQVIRDYPTPIAGCDEQFNHLLEQRDSALHHLRRLDDLCHEGAVQDDATREIAAFMDASAYGKTSARPADPSGR
jgi:hypothetical protein